MAKRQFVFKHSKSQKFWTIRQSVATCTIQFVLALLLMVGCNKVPQKGTLVKDEIDTLLVQLQDPDDAVRFAASRRLSKIGEPAVARLLDLLENGTPRGRAIAAHALAGMQDNLPGPLRDGTVLVALIKAINDPEGEVRDNACRAISLLGEKSSDRPALVKVLRTRLTDPAACVSAAFGIARFDPSSRDASRILGEALFRPEPPGSNLYQETCMILEPMGAAAAPAIPGLRHLLKHSDIDLRLSAIEALEKLAVVSAPARNDLEQLSRSVNADEAEAATKALAAIAANRQ